MAELLTTAEWCQRFGTKILDPDGWRRDNTPLEFLLDEEEFLTRWAESTCCGKNAALDAAWSTHINRDK